MIKKWFIVLFFVLALITFSGCSAGYKEGTIDYDNNSDVLPLADAETPVRKIIYTVTVSYDVQNLEDATDVLYGLLESDEWFDSEIVTATSRAYVIRVKTDRLDAFITALDDEFPALRSFKKVGTDISLDYQDTTNRILALEAQMERLLELYDQATLSEMIVINQQISEIEVELQQLNGELAQYDSLVDYSVINLAFYGNTVTTQSPFFNRLGNAFVNGFNALIDFFDGLFIVLATIFPFLVIFGAAAVGGLVIYKRRKMKRRPKPTPPEVNNQNE